MPEETCRFIGFNDRCNPLHLPRPLNVAVNKFKKFCIYRGFSEIVLEGDEWHVEDDVQETWERLATTAIASAMDVTRIQMRIIYQGIRNVDWEPSQFWP